VLIVLLTIAISGGCKKEENTNPADSSKIEFISLVVEKDNIGITELTKVSATVKGSNLTYNWKCDNELGVFEGSGSEVMFTICHGGKFKITCEVKDNASNQASKDVYVTCVE
jgi:hypothetical protein